MRLTLHPSNQPTISPPSSHMTVSADAAEPEPRQTSEGQAKPNHPSFRPPSARAKISRSLATATIAATLLGVLSADAAHAGTQVLALATSVDQVFTNIRNWLVGILAGLATVFLTVGGVRYLLAGGDPGEAEKAKGAFRNAAWGYGLAALAPLVVEILRGIVGA